MQAGCADSGSPPKAILTGPLGGLGAVFLDELCRAGWQVLAVSRSAAELPVRAGVTFVCADLSTAEGVASLLSAQADWFQSADLLVNNAGSGVLGSADDQGMEPMQRQLQLMLQTPIHLSLAVLPGMRHRGRGLILNITSLAGATGIPFMAGYTTAKAGLTGFTKALQLELLDSGVHVLEWCPGDIRSEFNQRLHKAGAPAAVWLKLERHMALAPHADCLRQQFRRLLTLRRGTPVWHPGKWSQVMAAFVASRWMPRCLMVRCVRRYFGLS
ncbi:MAG: SDR family NAD(P)-dependent oxidoreductase [Verrucomicrobia bacterium]|nr:SDR family NAD(P)-dependent oxidoreductase [Verrucomicrobiota bacterium]